MKKYQVHFKGTQDKTKKLVKRVSVKNDTQAINLAHWSIPMKDKDNWKHHKTLEEDAPTNAVGGGSIAGVGVGEDGEPGVSKLAQKRWKKRNGVMRRRAPRFKRKEV